eukprot:814333-Rhodomonas_salina.2
MDNGCSNDFPDMGSDDGGCDLIQNAGGVPGLDRDYPDLQEEPEGLAALPLSEVPEISAEEPAAGRGPGRGRGSHGGHCSGCGSGSRAAAVVAAAAQPADTHKNAAAWGAVNKLLPISVPAFFSTIGPTRLGEQALEQDQEKKEHVYQSKLFFFKNFIDQQFKSLVVCKTNHYVADMANQPRPDWAQHNNTWLPKWTVKWQPLNEATFMCWLAFLMVLLLHKTAGESEVFSRHWLYVRPCIQCFFNCEEHKLIKAALALHCQQAGEEAGVEAINGKPQLCKIGFLLDHIHTKCTSLYHPGPDCKPLPWGSWRNDQWCQDFKPTGLY